MSSCMVPYFIFVCVYYPDWGSGFYIGFRWCLMSGEQAPAASGDSTVLTPEKMTGWWEQTSGWNCGDPRGNHRHSTKAWYCNMVHCCSRLQGSNDGLDRPRGMGMPRDGPLDERARSVEGRLGRLLVGRGGEDDGGLWSLWWRHALQRLWWGICSNV